jgi:hypothetical protein
LLEKDPKKRLTLEDVKRHPWITKNGLLDEIAGPTDEGFV